MLDFLFLVGEVEEKGYNGDSVEAALLNHNKDVAKVKRVNIIITKLSPFHSLSLSLVIYDVSHLFSPCWYSYVPFYMYLLVLNQFALLVYTQCIFFL